MFCKYSEIQYKKDISSPLLQYLPVSYHDLIDKIFGRLLLISNNKITNSNLCLKSMLYSNLALLLIFYDTEYLLIEIYNLNNNASYLTITLSKTPSSFFKSRESQDTIISSFKHSYFNMLFNLLFPFPSMKYLLFSSYICIHRKCHYVSRLQNYFKLKK